MTREDRTQVENVFMDGLDLDQAERTGLLKKQLAERADLQVEVQQLWDLDAGAEENPLNSLPEAMLTLLAQGEGLSRAFGDYQIQAQIGQGGMGAVYRAWQLSLDRVVALKTLPRTWSFDGHLNRFKREMQLLARMSHPHIAQVFDSGQTDDGRPFFTMELLDGKNLLDYHRDRTYTAEQVFGLMIDICDAVQHAHQKGIVHRDLKPSNILVVGDASGAQVKIIDFGVAGSPGDLPVGGTPGYAAPEVIEGGSADTRSDIYALGVILDQLCTEQVRANLSKSRCGELKALIQRARALEAKDRYASCAQLKADLDAWLCNRPLAAGPDGTVYPLRKWLARNRAPLAAGCLLVALALFAAIALWLSEQRRLRTESARLEADRQALQAEGRAQAVNAFLVEIFGQVGPLGQGRLVPAVTLLERAAQDAGTRYADAPDLEAAIRVALGRAFKGLGEYGQACLQHERADRLLRGELGPAHVRTLRNLGELAYLYRLQGQLGAAETAYRQCLDLLRGHPAADDFVWIKGLLAELLGDKGHYQEAETLFEETLRVQVAQRPLHQTTLGTRENLGRLILKRGDVIGAVALFEEVVAAWEEKGNADHPRLLTARYHLARARDKAGDRSADLYRRVLKSQTRLLGAAHPDTLGTYSNLAIRLGRNGQTQEAVSLLEEGLAAGAENHPASLRLKHNLGEYLMRLKEPTRALHVLRETAAARARVLGEEHPDTLLTRVTLAEALTATGDYTEALPLLRQVWESATCIFGPTARLTGLYRAVLGRTLLEMGQYGEAADHLLHAYHQLGRANHSWAPRTKMWLQRANKLVGRELEKAG